MTTMSGTLPMNDKIVLTRLELRTIMEDAFIDGWRQGEDSDWFDPEDFLKDHEDPVILEETKCETAVAIKNLMEEKL